MQNVIKLDLATPSVQFLYQKDKRLAKLINMVGPIMYTPYSESPYSFLVHEIIEQMLSVKAGQTIYQRLETLCDKDITPEKVAMLSDEQLRSTGTSFSKVEYIRNITNAVINEEICFEDLEKLSDAEIINALTKIRGIGKWTSKMCLIFIFDRPDVLPSEDSAFLQVYRWIYKTNDCSEQAVIEKCKKWKPYSSIAARFFYKALDSGITKEEFHLYK